MSFTGKLALASLAAVGTGLAVAAAVRKRRHLDLAGQVVLLTGGSRGLGLEIGRQLVDAGARLAICARDEAELAEAQLELESRGGEVFAAPCDVTVEADVKRLVSQVRERFGRVDVLINNAGMIVVGPSEQMTAEDYDLLMATNFRGPLALMLEVLPEMTRRGAGRVVNVASVGGLMPVPHLAGYCASKHALVGLSQALRADLVRRGVYVSCVCPGVISTGSPRHALYKGDVAAEYEWFAGSDNTPGVAASPEDVAEVVIDAAVTGDALRVTPTQVKLQAALHGAFAGASTEVSGLIARLLPADPGGGPGPAVKGYATGGDLPGPLRRRQEEAALTFNQY